MNRETITLESIKKLRESSHLDDYKWTLETGEVVNIYGNEPNDLNAVNWGEQWRNIADEIEAEITAKYMKTPLDAVGTPIHVGDKVFWYAVGYFDVIGIGEQVVLDKGDSRFAIVPSDVLEVVATRFSDAFVAMPTREIKIYIEPGTELKEGSVIHIDDDGNMTLEA